MTVTQIKATKDKSPWEQYHITLLSHLALYWIWSMLDSGERLLVTGVSPPIFGSQNCCRFRNPMQLNIRDLRLNTLYNKLPFYSKSTKPGSEYQMMWIQTLDSFYWSIRVGMLLSKKFEKLFKTREWKHTRRWSENWSTSHFQEWKISLRV